MSVQNKMTQTRVDQIKDIMSIAKDEDGWKDLDIDNIMLEGMYNLMNVKLMKSRKKGKGGWWTEECPVEYLEALLAENLEKGDMVDVAILAGMIHMKRGLVE